MNLPNTHAPDTLLSGEQAAQVAALQRDIAVLREARDCVTDSATPAMIYGRVDDLINRRQDVVLGIFQQARVAASEGAQRHG